MSDINTHLPLYLILEMIALINWRVGVAIGAAAAFAAILVPGVTRWVSVGIIVLDIAIYGLASVTIRL
jgi:hypothetical protein